MVAYAYNDGGRAAAGYKGIAGDCVVRALAIVTERPYKEVYATVQEFCKKHGKGSARTGVPKEVTRALAEHYGLKWVPVMRVGSGVTMHVSADELPSGRLMLKLSRHVVACIDGVIHDTYDASRDGRRAVYGYWVMDN